jgi:hypothetical protein
MYSSGASDRGAAKAPRVFREVEEESSRGSSDAQHWPQHRRVSPNRLRRMLSASARSGSPARSRRAPTASPRDHYDLVSQHHVPYAGGPLSRSARGGPTRQTTTYLSSYAFGFYHPRLATVGEDEAHRRLSKSSRNPTTSLRSSSTAASLVWSLSIFIVATPFVADQDRAHYANHPTRASERKTQIEMGTSKPTADPVMCWRKRTGLSARA